MAISSHLDSFAGFDVRDFDPAAGLQDTATTIYRLRKDPDAGSPPKRSFFSRKPAPPPKPADPLAALLADPASRQLQGIVYGAWMEDFDSSVDSGAVVRQLAEAAAQLPSLKV